MKYSFTVHAEQLFKVSLKCRCSRTYQPHNRNQERCRFCLADQFLHPYRKNTLNCMVKER